MDFNQIFQGQLEIALKEEHDPNHEFEGSEFDPRMCGHCGWYTLDSPRRPGMSAILQSLRDGTMVIGEPVLNTIFIFQDVTVVVSRRWP